MTAKKNRLLPYCYFDGEFVANEDAKISVTSQSIQYGATCFGGLRGYVEGNTVRLLRLEDHFNRLMSGAKILGMKIQMEFEEFKSILKKLTQLNQLTQDTYIRIFLYTDEDSVSPRFDLSPFKMALYMMVLTPYLNPNVGVRLSVSSWRKYSDSSISVKAKAGGAYLNSALATTEAQNNGYDEALLLDHQDHLCESSIANTILSYQNELFAPPTGAGALDGWTLRTVIQLLADEGLKVKREPIDRSMIYSADELLLTGTAAQIKFAGSVDGRLIGQGQEGPVCKLIRKKYSDLVQGRHPRSKDWLCFWDIEENLPLCQKVTSEL